MWQTAFIYSVMLATKTSPAGIIPVTRLPCQTGISTGVGFGLVFHEADASGKPADAGKARGTGSAVVDGEAGLRVDQLRELALMEI